MSGNDALTKAIADGFDRLSAPILISSLLLTAFLASFLVPLPEFTTDLSSFAPDTEADDANERADASMGPSSHLIYINVKPSVGDNEIPNVLEMGALHELAEDHRRVEEYSEQNGGFVTSQINAAEVLQRFIEDRNYSGQLSDFSDWQQMLTEVLEGDECGDAVSSDERTIATAAFASSAMLHKDLDYQPVCDWLETGEGNPTPRADSTLWLIEMSGGVSNEERQLHATVIREMLGEGSVLEYGVISDDLISNDINESTLDNLVWLILLAVIVVVILLALTFRSIAMVAAPLTALLASLVWTYGTITMLGMKFSILELSLIHI